MILRGPLTRCVKLRVAHAAEMAGTFPRHRLQTKPLDSDPGMHHGTCVTHVPGCMSGSLTRGGIETFPAFPGPAQPAIYVSGKRPMTIGHREALFPRPICTVLDINNFCSTDETYIVSNFACILNNATNS